MKTIGVSLALIIELTGCQQRPSTPSGSRLAHPNGLELSRPAGFEATQTADGFVLEEGGQLRSPRRVEVRLVRTPLAIPEPDRRRLLARGAIARYSIREMEGGSGGAEYELRALEAIGDGWIVLVAREQSELGEPDFGEAWRLLESARRRAD
jgi:hypothetical protein